MYDEELIKKFLPKIDHLANKYANDNCEYDELFSEGQYYILLYMNDHENVDEHLMYTGLNNRLRKFAKETEENNVVDIENVIVYYEYKHVTIDDLIDTCKTLLSERAYDIFINYYSGVSLAELSKKHGISRSRVMAIRNKALNTIRSYYKTNNIKLEDL